MDERDENETTGETTGAAQGEGASGAAAEIALSGAVDDALDGSGADALHADELERAIQEFLAEVGSGVVSVSRVVNPLLQVWSVARDVDAEVAVPVEQLLTVLVGRALTTSTELSQTMTEVRAILAGPGRLATV